MPLRKETVATSVTPRYHPSAAEDSTPLTRQQKKNPPAVKKPDVAGIISDANMDAESDGSWDFMSGEDASPSPAKLPPEQARPAFAGNSGWDSDEDHASPKPQTQLSSLPSSTAVGQAALQENLRNAMTPVTDHVAPQQPALGTAGSVKADAPAPLLGYGAAPSAVQPQAEAVFDEEEEEEEDEDDVPRPLKTRGKPKQKKDKSKQKDKPTDKSKEKNKSEDGTKRGLFGRKSRQAAAQSQPTQEPTQQPPQQPVAQQSQPHPQLHVPQAFPVATVSAQQAQNSSSQQSPPRVQQQASVVRGAAPAPLIPSEAAGAHVSPPRATPEHAAAPKEEWDAIVYHSDYAGAAANRDTDDVHTCKTLPTTAPREVFLFQEEEQQYAARSYDQGDVMDTCATNLELDSRRVFAVGFTALRALVDIVLALLFELLRLVFHIVRKLSVEILALVSDILLKPLLHVLFNGVIHPLFVFVRHVFSGLKGAVEPLIHMLDPAVEQVVSIVRAFRLVEYHHHAADTQHV